MMQPQDGGDQGLDAPPVIQNLLTQTTRAQQRVQVFLDSTTPYAARRWGATAGLLILFMLRVIIGQGWYIICYALFIYLLNLFLAFLQPKFDPSIEADLAEQDVEEGEPGLPTSASSSGGFGKSARGGGGGGLMSGMFGTPAAASGEEEFRPFIRRLPEFKFWLGATQAILISLGCTITRAFDIPVFVPILVLYFFILFGITMRRQIAHMVKYKYVPFDLGRKQRYGAK